MSKTYSFQQFFDAVHSMATSPSSIQQRIANAYTDQLIHVTISDLPDEIHHRFNELQQKLTSTEAVNSKGTIQTSIENMNTEEAVELAKSILYMADIVRSIPRV